MNKNIFRKASLDSISSPEQLNDYIKVSTPSVWIVLAALIVLVGAVIAWGFAGNLPTTISVPCMASDGIVHCYLSTEDASKVRIGQPALITWEGLSDVKGKVASVGTVPMSQAEIHAEIKSDYLVQRLTNEQFAVKVIITPEEIPKNYIKTLLVVNIIADSIRPIDFLLK